MSFTIWNRHAPCQALLLVISDLQLRLSSRSLTTALSTAQSRPNLQRYMSGEPIQRAGRSQLGRWASDLQLQLENFAFGEGKARGVFGLPSATEGFYYPSALWRRILILFRAGGRIDRRIASVSNKCILTHIHAWAYKTTSFYFVQRLQGHWQIITILSD